MGKKRQFKRSDDKKGASPKSSWQQPPPGILTPGETSYVDNRSASHSYSVPSPPFELTEDEMRAQQQAREDEEARELEEVRKKMEATRKKYPDQKPPVSDTTESLPEIKQNLSDNKQSLSDGKQNLSDPFPATVEVTDDESEDAQAESDSAESESSDNKETSDDPGETPVGERKRKTIAELLEEAESDVEMEADRRRLLAGAWRARDQVYQQLFGKPAYVTPANYSEPTEEVPANWGHKPDMTGVDTSNPGDPPMEEQHLAVLAYGPDPEAPYWKYVTAGLASPWVQYEPLQVSGFGCELMVKSPVDAPWAAQFLRTLAFYIFNHAGTLSQGVRLKLNSPIDPASNSELRNAFIWYADEAPDTLYELPSGLFSVLLAVGITDDELKFADSVEEYGTWAIQALLKQSGINQVTDPTRKSVMEHENINAMKMSVRNFAETFRANRAGKFTVDDTTFS